MPDLDYTTVTPVNEQLKLASVWIDAGYCVLPCLPWDEMVNGKLRKIKAPYVGPYTNASAEPEQIAQWWDQWPDALVGVVPSSGGAWVADVDNKNGQRGTQNLSDAGITLENGQVSLSGNGTHHWYMADGLDRDQQGNGSHILDDEDKPVKDVDVRCCGGYVVVRYSPPELMSMPEGLKARIKHASSATRHKVKPEQVDEWLSEHEGDPYGNARHEKQLHKFEKMSERQILNHENAKDATWSLVKSASPGDGTAVTLRELRQWFTLNDPEWSADFDELLAGAIGDALNPEPVDVEPAEGWSKSPAEMIALAQEDEHWLIEGLVPAHAAVLLAGEPGVGKSFVALTMAAKVATGQDFFTSAVEPDEPRTVAYVLGEGFSRFGDRVSALQRDMGELPDDRLRFVDGAGHGVNLSDLASVTETCAQLAVIDPDLVVLDTFSMLAQVESENDNAGIADVMRVAGQMISEFGCSVMIVHHVNKSSGDVRGAGAFKGNVDTVVVAKRTKGDQFKLSTQSADHGKQRDGEPVSIDGYSIVSDERGDGLLAFARSREEPAKKPDHVLNAIIDALDFEEWRTTAELHDLVEDYSKNPIDERLKRIREEKPDQVEWSKNGRGFEYRLLPTSPAGENN